MKGLSAFLVGLAALAAPLRVAADEHTHKYQDGEEVVVWMNVVGPYHNSQETYPYYSLPFCRGSHTDIEHHHESMAEALQGVELETSGLDVRFKKDLGETEYCRVVLSDESAQQFVYAVENRYTFEMYVDDLPVMGWLGDMLDGSGQPMEEPKEGAKHYLYTHKKFEIFFNNDQIIEVTLQHDNKAPIVPGKELVFTYEVRWHPTDTSFEDRFDKFLDPMFFKHKIHWFSIFNSFMMVIFLVGLVAMILMRTLRRDYARYSREEDLDDMERDLGDEYGWKQVHSDVFRTPPGLLLFSSLIGTGAQLATAAFITITAAIVGDLYEGRGELLTTAIYVYAATSVVGGFVGGSMYMRSAGKTWIKQMVVQATLFPGLVCGMTFMMNFVAISYNSSKAIPFTAMLSITAIGLFIVLPLTLVGAVVGRSVAGQPNFPCRVNPVPRPIPEKQWYMEPVMISILGGILPFGSIFIEMYFIFSSFWAYKIYYVYGFMALVFVILVIVTICVDIVCVYFLLNSEDYRWYVYVCVRVYVYVCVRVYVYVSLWGWGMYSPLLSLLLLST
eukprot:comp23892_c2_seq1/m.41966 comp23892_c2_seq1/g.41966  ORF comp23892_c2_seq1/g.41966 comp23892_c2_seq1/m.41966 type:complete len:558 (-) comp23892_c2_seq1:158-1831(-)